MLIVAIATVLGGSLAAFANHGACGGDAGMINLTPVPPLWNGVGVKTSPNSAAVCYSFGGTTGPCGVLTVCGGHQVTLNNTATPGKTVSTENSVYSVNQPTGATGAEAGTVSGTTVTGTTVWGAGTPQSIGINGLAKPRATSVAHGPDIPICIVLPCQYVPGPGYKADTGYDLVVLSSSTKLCASVGTPTC